MSVRASRLTGAEGLLGAAAVLLIVDLFALSWFVGHPGVLARLGSGGTGPSASGWDAFPVLGPLTLVVGLGALAVVWLTATRPSPALPVVLATLLLPVSFLQALLVAVRVLLDPPSAETWHGVGPAVQTRPGAFLGVALSMLIAACVVLSLRRDALASADAAAVGDAVALRDPSGGAPA